VFRGVLLCNVGGCQSFRGTCFFYQNPIAPEDEQQVAQKYWYLQDNKVSQLDDLSLMNSSPFRSMCNTSVMIQHFNLQLMHSTLKNVELLEHFKISKTAPTCFGLQGNHHQGATIST